MSTLYYSLVDTTSHTRALRDKSRRITSVIISDTKLYEKGRASFPTMILKVKEKKYETQQFSAEGVDDQAVAFIDDSLVTSGSIDSRTIDKDGYHIPDSLNQCQLKQCQTRSTCAHSERSSATTRAPSAAPHTYNSLETGRFTDA